MSFGGGGEITNEETRSLSLRIQQSAYGGAKTRVWGSYRVPGNMLDYMDFVAIPHTTRQSMGGKGGSITSANTSYTYTAGIIIGLCSGEIAGIGKVWKDKDLTYQSALGLTLKTGTLNQAAWSHLTANHPARAVHYSGIAYVANATFDLGEDPSQPNLNFEVFGERIIPGTMDADPAGMITDIVTDPIAGAGLPTLLENLDDYALWCNEMGLSLSLGVTDQKASRDVISQVLKATLAEAIWSAGCIKIIPYGDEQVGDWVPNQTPVYDLSEADLLDAPRHRRTQPADAVNRVTLNYASREKDYNTATLMRDDLAAVTQFGVRAETIDLPCITREDVGIVVCEFWRDRGLYIRNTWELSVDERFCLVEPMDLLTLSFGPQGLNSVAVRVVEIDDDGQGRISITVEEWPFGLLKATAIPTQQISGYVPEHNVAPGPVNAPVIFEAPSLLTAPNLEIWIAASGGDQWGGAYVWVSDDGNSYQQIGTITNPARHGVLAGQLAAGADPDTAHTLFVDMAPSGGQLQSGTQADADNGNTALWVDGEVISYQTATLTAEDKYSLSYLRRGQAGTINASHASGGAVVRLDEALFSYRVPTSRIGTTIWVKLQSYNKYGRAPESLDSVQPYSHTISGHKPLPLVGLTADGGLFEVALGWSLTPGVVGIDYVEIWGNTVNDRASAYQLTSQKAPTAAWKHPGLLPAQSWYYWGRVIDTSGNPSDWYPANAVGGVAATVDSDPALLLQMLEAAVGQAQLAPSLATPIAKIPEIETNAAQVPAIAADIIQRALDIDALTERALFERAVTDATISVDPVTGAIELLATANVTTDVEARLTQVETDLDAAAGTLTSTVATVATLGTDIDTAQSQITQLAGEVSSKASTVYVDDAIETSTGALTVEAANNAQALAETAIRQALGLDAATDKELAARARIASAEQTLTTQADELTAEAAARLELAAIVAQGDQTNAAAIQTEQSARANADTSLAQQISTLQAAVTQGDQTSAAAIQTEQTARTTADTALAQQISTLQSAVGEDLASIAQTATATANALGEVQAEWGVDVQAMADGVHAAVGLRLLAGTDGESVFAILADKLLVYRPDGMGAPKQVITLGEINGQEALGLAGNLIMDGSIIARHIAVESLSAITAQIGTLRTASTGARLEISDNVIKVFDAGGVCRVKLGNLAL